MWHIVGRYMLIVFMRTITTVKGYYYYICNMYDDPGPIHSIVNSSRNENPGNENSDTGVSQNKYLST